MAAKPITAAVGSAFTSRGTHADAAREVAQDPYPLGVYGSLLAIRRQQP
jgi:hypothetical protein